MNSFIEFTDYSGNVYQKTNDDIHKMNIRNYLSEVCDHKGYIRRNYNSLNEYYDVIPDDIIERFKIDPFSDYILENMNSHDSLKLYNVLKSFFSEFGVSITNPDHNQKGNSLLSIIIPCDITLCPLIERILKSEELNNILDFYGYYVTNHRFVNIKGEDVYFIGIEPEYSENVNNFVYGKCFGQLYHITDSANYDSIMSSGLRMRNGNGSTYRNFPKRIYFIAIEPSRRMNINNYLSKAVKNFIDRNKCDHISIFKINLYGHDINFYTDDVSRKVNGMDNCVYCYSNIPPELITPVYNGKIDPFIK